jgi:hypothetical protein
VHWGKGWEGIEGSEGRRDGLRGVDVSGLGVEAVADDFDDVFRGWDFERTHPVSDSERDTEAELFEWAFFPLLDADGFFFRRWWWCFSGDGIRAREDCESRVESWLKVLIASMREALERFMSAV